MKSTAIAVLSACAWFARATDDHVPKDDRDDWYEVQEQEEEDVAPWIANAKVSTTIGGTTKGWNR